METLIGIAVAVLAAALALRLLTLVSKLAIVIAVVGVLALAWFHPSTAELYVHEAGRAVVHLIGRALG